MKPLKTTQRVLTWLCIYPLESNAGKWEKLMCVVFSSIVFVALSSVVFASLAFVWKFIAIDFNASMDALYPVMGWTPLINSFVMMILLNRHIVAIFQALENIYNKRKAINCEKTNTRPKISENILSVCCYSTGMEKEDGSIQFLITVDEKCEQAWKFYFKYGMIGSGASTITTFLMSILWIIFTQQPFNRDNLYLPYKLLYAFH